MKEKQNGSELGYIGRAEILHKRILDDGMVVLKLAGLPEGGIPPGTAEAMRIARALGEQKGGNNFKINRIKDTSPKDADRIGWVD